jgi:hypothetical protein
MGFLRLADELVNRLAGEQLAGQVELLGGVRDQGSDREAAGA